MATTSWNIKTENQLDLRRARNQAAKKQLLREYYTHAQQIINEDELSVINTYIIKEHTTYKHGWLYYWSHETVCAMITSCNVVRWVSFFVIHSSDSQLHFKKKIKNNLIATKVIKIAKQQRAHSIVGSFPSISLGVFQRVLSHSLMYHTKGRAIQQYV